MEHQRRRVHPQDISWQVPEVQVALAVRRLEVEVQSRTNGTFALRPSLPISPPPHELPIVALRVDLGGGRAIFAHNVLSHGDEMRDFLEVIQDHPGLETWIERRSSAGISVSVKGR